jgi:hypothetical protein
MGSIGETGYAGSCAYTFSPSYHLSALDSRRRKRDAPIEKVQQSDCFAYFEFVLDVFAPSVVVSANQHGASLHPMGGISLSGSTLAILPRCDCAIQHLSLPSVGAVPRSEARKGVIPV